MLKDFIMSGQDEDPLLQCAQIMKGEDKKDKNPFKRRQKRNKRGGQVN